MKRETSPDPDDMFADTRMTFGEHIEDLRTHLLRAIKGFFIAFLIAIPLGQPILRFIAAPVEDQLQRFSARHNERRGEELEQAFARGAYRNFPPVALPLWVEADPIYNMIAKRMNLPTQEPPVLSKLVRSVDRHLERMQLHTMIDYSQIDHGRFVEMEALIADPMKYAKDIFMLNHLINPPRLTTLSVQEAFMVLFKVILMTGFVLASPWVFYQIWSFIAAGLYPQEKRLVNVYLPFSIALFLVGVFVCELFVIPKAIEAMLWFNEFLGFQPDLRLNEWLGFAIFMPLVFGISFQTPLVMLFTEKIGLFDVQTFKDKRKMAWFLMAIFAAVITPSTDAFSMMFLWVPMSLLYELGIVLCVLSPRPPEEEWETSESEEMVEV